MESERPPTHSASGQSALVMFQRSAKTGSGAIQMLPHRSFRHPQLLRDLGTRPSLQPVNSRHQPHLGRKRLQRHSHVSGQLCGHRTPERAVIVWRGQQTGLIDIHRPTHVTTRLRRPPPAHHAEKTPRSSPPNARDGARPRARRRRDPRRCPRAAPPPPRGFPRILASVKRRRSSRFSSQSFMTNSRHKASSVDGSAFTASASRSLRSCPSFGPVLAISPS